ncbi:hypothetical protein APY03_1489 [Variovorax sp. WDL1]|nr:hypothetical protein APY03_1489 [Variovorax sp. WDL1]
MDPNGRRFRRMELIAERLDDAIRTSILAINVVADVDLADLGL